MRAHGTRTKYAHDHCRCLPCRMANARYESARIAARRLPWRVRCVGSGRWYRVVGTDRADDVRLQTTDRSAAIALRDELNAAALRDDAGDPLWASGGHVAQVRRHVRTLLSHGMTLRQIGRQAELSRTRLQEIVLGRSYNADRPRRRRLKLASAERLLAVQVSVPDGEFVPAAETWQRIDILVTRGMPKARIAAALGRKSPAIQLSRTRVTRRNAEAVRALFESIVFGRGAAA